jgi:hypothetical protein
LHSSEKAKVKVQFKKRLQIFFESNCVQRWDFLVSGFLTALLLLPPPPLPLRL